MTIWVSDMLYEKSKILANPKFKVDEDIHRYLLGKFVCIQSGGYVQVSHDGRQYLLHRFVMNAKPCEYVDHKSGDILDNRRSNLKICTQRENIYNRITMRKSKSGLRCIYKKRRRRPWRCSLRTSHGQISRGLFSLNIARCIVHMNISSFHTEYGLTNFDGVITTRKAQEYFYKYEDVTLVYMSAVNGIEKVREAHVLPKVEGVDPRRIRNGLMFYANTNGQTRCLYIRNLIMMFAAGKVFIVKLAG